MGSDVPTIRETSDKASQEFGQYSGSGCIFQMMYELRIALSITNRESQTLCEAICNCSYEKSKSFNGHLHLRRGRQSSLKCPCWI